MIPQNDFQNYRPITGNYWRHAWKWPISPKMVVFKHVAKGRQGLHKVQRGSFYHNTCRVKRVNRFFENNLFWDTLIVMFNISTFSTFFRSFANVSPSLHSRSCWARPQLFGGTDILLLLLSLLGRNKTFLTMFNHHLFFPMFNWKFRFSLKR